LGQFNRGRNTAADALIAVGVSTITGEVLLYRVHMHGGLFVM